MLKDLQSKIPLLKKKSAAAEEEENYEEEETDVEVSGDDATNTAVADPNDPETEVGGQSQSSSMLMRLRDKIMKRKPEEEQELSGDEGDEDDEDRPKKPKVDKKRLAIQGVIALGIVLAVAQEYLPGIGGGGEEELPEDQAVTLKPRPKPKPKKPEQDTQADANGDTTGTPTAETPTTETPVDTTITDNPVDQAPSTDPSTTAGVDVTTETPNTDTPMDTTGGVGTDVTPDTSPVSVTETSTTGSDSVDTSTMDPTAGMTSEGSTGGEEGGGDALSTGGGAGGIETTGLGDSDIGSVTSPDKIDGGMLGGGAPDMTEQMLKELEKEANVPKVRTPVTEYAAPPDYEFKGRGLVYNCVGKHWACVDGPSYRRCEDNSSSLKFLNKKTECYPFNVYETLKGCEAMQNRMVSSSAKTEFCDEI